MLKPFPLSVHQWAPGLFFRCWNKLFCKELMLLVDQSRQREFLSWLLLQSSVNQAAPVHAHLYPALICHYRIMPHSVSLHGKGEAPERHAGDAGTESTEQWGACVGKLWCEQHGVFLLYVNTSIRDALWTRHDVQDSLKTKNHLLGKRRGDMKIFAWILQWNENKIVQDMLRKWKNFLQKFCKKP